MSVVKPSSEAAPQDATGDTGDRPAIGIAWMLVTMFWFVSLDAIAKYLMETYPVVQVIWARFFFSTLAVAVVMHRSLRYQWRSGRLSLQLARSSLMLLTTTLFFFGVSTTPLTTASTIMFLAPIIVTVLSIPLLGEQVGVRRWAGVIIGFIGAVIVVRPGVAGLSTGMLFLLAAATGYALYQLATRQIRHYDSPMTSLLYTGLIGAVVMSIIVPFHWSTPTLSGWAMFCGLGICGSIGHLCLIRAMRRASASVVAPFSYTSLVWATVFGYVLFGDLPTIYTLAGAGLIISSGLYIFHRERLVKP